MALNRDQVPRIQRSEEAVDPMLLHSLSERSVDQRQFGAVAVPDPRRIHGPEARSVPSLATHGRVGEA
jgi:hypothetical protein